ncbi:MAG: phosphoenolpyruvate carboxykinase (ATP) [Dehalococcoidales bacterium]|nr:phosphoenolpyruvate carboxykinase (ATP) [Dehalococcoidales bacterium]
MPEFDLNLFPQTIDRIRAKAIKDGRLLDNPPDEVLEKLTEKEQGVKRTKYGSLVAYGEPTSRAQAFTKNSVDDVFGQVEVDLLKQCEQILSQKKLISIDRTVGNYDSGVVVRVTVPEEFAHTVFGGGKLFVPVKGKVKQPNYEIIFFGDEHFESNKTKPLAEKDITIRLAMLPDGRVLKIVRNGNYIGEFKKGVFAAEDWAAKTYRGGIFLHAGCREDYLQSVRGEYRTTRSLLIALSANGKTTTSSKILARKGKEKSWLVQDDGGTLMPDGSFHGFEQGGIFVKTENVNPGDQFEIYYGLLRPGTFCENVHVTKDGDFDFYNLEGTANGRAVVQRRDFLHTSPHIDVEKVDNLIIITRGPIIPAIAKLTMEQAVAFMILGQAMESSAGDPSRAGTIRSEFFYDPFVAGDKAEHANRLYDILKGLPHMKYFLLNTGGIGEGERYLDIKLEHTIGILDSLFRGGLEDWMESVGGLEVPAAVRMVDDIYFHPEIMYPRAVFDAKLAELNDFRKKAIAAVGPKLNPAIKKVFK